jgi:hypothetical protein
MIKLNPDIFLFDNIIPDDLILKLLEVRKNSNHTDRIDLHLADLDLLREFDNFWMSGIEPRMMDDFFSVYDIENNIGFNASEDTVNNLKNWIKTKWRDLYLLSYNTMNSYRGDKDVHWDFSGLTFVGCLTDEYEGGILSFPRQNISTKLKKGDIIIFPGGITHPHCVSSITKGSRNVIIGQSLNIKDSHWIEY